MLELLRLNMPDRKRSRVAVTLPGAGRVLRTVVFAAVLGAALQPAFAAETVSALLLRKTQAFSDAGQRGDGASMAAMLDDAVIFVNESGEAATKADLSQAGPAPAPGSSVKMTVTDWHCQVHGNVAVTSFIDDQRIEGPTPLHARYRSVETWLRSAATWKMIASETIALVDDPSSVTLSSSDLNEYVGTYRAASGQTVVLARSGEHLTASVGGGAAVEQAAEVRDVLFTPGRARFRKVFRRDATGRVVGFASRREGHDLVFDLQPGTGLAPGV